MLVISRREGEEIVIGDPKHPIGFVRIASVRGDKVRLALEFPMDIEVHRREIADRILAKESASDPEPSSPATHRDVSQVPTTT
jgi:carbon storage regulator CsrA